MRTYNCYNVVPESNHSEELICPSMWLQRVGSVCLMGRSGHTIAFRDTPLHTALQSGATVTIARCDAAATDEVAALLSSTAPRQIQVRHPHSQCIHTTFKLPPPTDRFYSICTVACLSVSSLLISPKFIAGRSALWRHS